MILFAHTPKCGGKSFRESLKKVYGERLLLDYANPLNRTVKNRLSQIRAYYRVKSTLHQFDIVYGHFSFARYRTMSNGSNAQFGMFFREPIALISSYYYYIVEKYPERPAPPIKEFVEQKKHVQFYRAFLGHLSADQLHFVGIFEEYGKSLRLYEAMFGQKLDEHHINKTQSKPRNYHDELKKNGNFTAVNQAMHQNQIIYDTAVARFEALCAKYGVA
ncbi:MAG: hypothetical protein AAF490_15160 [Chloroflexota bacterium]